MLTKRHFFVFFKENKYQTGMSSVWNFLSFIFLTLIMPHILLGEAQKKSPPAKSPPVSVHKTLEQRVNHFIQRASKEANSEKEKHSRLQEEIILRQDLSKRFAEQQKNNQSVYTTMQLCKNVRRVMLLGYSDTIRSQVPSYGSLGCVLLFHQGRLDQKSFNILLREAWLFSRAARTALFLLAQTRFALFPKGIRAALLQKTSLFYQQAFMEYHRTEEGCLLVQLSSQMPSSTQPHQTLKSSVLNLLTEKATPRTLESVLLYIMLETPEKKKQVHKKLKTLWKKWWYQKRMAYKKRYDKKENTSFTAV